MCRVDWAGRFAGRVAEVVMWNLKTQLSDTIFPLVPQLRIDLPVSVTFLLRGKEKIQERHFGCQALPKSGRWPMPSAHSLKMEFIFIRSWVQIWKDYSMIFRNAATSQSRTFMPSSLTEQQRLFWFKWPFEFCSMDYFRSGAVLHTSWSRVCSNRNCTLFEVFSKPDLNPCHVILPAQYIRNPLIQKNFTWCQFFELSGGTCICWKAPWIFGVFSKKYWKTWVQWFSARAEPPSNLAFRKEGWTHHISQRLL